MIVDTSTIVAILRAEDDAGDFRQGNCRGRLVR